MKRILIAFVGALTLLLTACDTNTPSGPIPESFPKKHLIEEFTGQACGYCPYGMDCIHEFVANDTNWIVVLHHYGYAADHFTVNESKTVTNALNVGGAPQMCINRTKTKTGAGNTIVFHPAYLEDASKSQFETTTYASVEIENKYNADARELKIHVSGALSRTDIETLHLTVLVKESGMIDTQADYLGSFEGWKEFRHTNAVRAFLTAAKGDEVLIKKQRYSADYTLTLNEKWVPENCMVVAFLSEDFKPVVQAEQRPVVAGTQGGADIHHGGVTPVPVSDFYPEPNATDGPSTYSGAEVDTLTYAVTGVSGQAENLKEWTIMAYDQNGNIKVSGTRCIPFTYLYLYTTADVDTIPYGTYELNNTYTAGSALAGYRDDARQQIEGCIYYYTGRSYFLQGYLDPRATWLIADGTVTISEEGFEVVGHARNGADIHFVGPKPTIEQDSSAPAKMKRP